MKAIYKNIALAALALSAVACTQEEDFAPSYLNDPDAVRITAQVATGNVTGGFTRSNPLGTTEAEQKAFNSGDAIAVTAGNQDAVTYIFNGTTWTPEEGKYLKWEADEMNFTAWYPVGQGTDANTFTVPTSYADVNAMAAADYMVYSGSQSKTDGNSVTLPMKRKMARIVITPILKDEFPETNYSITGIKVHANTSGYANGTVKIGSIEVTALEQGDAYYALLAPTTAADATFLTVTVTKTDDSTSQEFTVKGIPTTEAGKSYKYTLTVGKAEATIGSVKVNPWTDGTINGGKAEEEKPTPYLTFSAKEEQQLTMTVKGNDGYLKNSLKTLEYSLNGVDWGQLNADTPIAFGGSKGDLLLRGKSSIGTAIDYWSNYSTISFSNNVAVACSGDIRTLINWENYAQADTQNARFCYLFSMCEQITTAPKLPATTLTKWCYFGLFNWCTSLTAAPELPATTLAGACYQYMFTSCTSLVAAPELPATTLASECYLRMFEKCSGLTTAPELPATTLAYKVYSMMFYGCTSLTNAPELPATTLSEWCYYQMFYGCEEINSVTMLATDISAANCLNGWLNNAGTQASNPTIYTATGVMLTEGTHYPDYWSEEVYNN